MISLYSNVFCCWDQLRTCVAVMIVFVFFAPRQRCVQFEFVNSSTFRQYVYCFVRLFVWVHQPIIIIQKNKSKTLVLVTILHIIDVAMKILSKNKRWHFDYEISDKLTVGIQLFWHEVKSIRTNTINLDDAYIKISERSLHLINMLIPLYTKANLKQIGSYESRRTRQLLANRREILKLRTKTHKTSWTIIALELYETSTHLLKLTIWVGTLKKKVDKKNTLKERDQIRQMNREISDY